MAQPPPPPPLWRSRFHTRAAAPRLTIEYVVTRAASAVSVIHAKEASSVSTDPEPSDEMEHDTEYHVPPGGTTENLVTYLRDVGVNARCLVGARRRVDGVSAHRAREPTRKAHSEWRVALKPSRYTHTTPAPSNTDAGCHAAQRCSRTPAATHLPVDGDHVMILAVSCPLNAR